MDFTVSVIIPTYNAQDFIDKTIQSVLMQTEVTEIVVVDDGSKDDSLKVLQALQKEHKSIKVFQHEKGVNKGRGATRNLGILKATSNYIAFLDADDFYLENRFSLDKTILKDQAIDGVYNAVGFHFYRDIKPNEQKHFKLNTITKTLKPEDLFDGIVKSKYGFLHLNGITIKRKAFSTIGLMNPELIVTQDTDIIFKMALQCCMLPSNITNPIALRGIHDDNIFNKDEIYKKYTPKCFESVIDWSFKNNIEICKIEALVDAIWVFKFKQKEGLISHIDYWFKLMFKFPKLLFSMLSIKYFPIVRLRKTLFPFIYKN
ncbi:beta-1,3-glucosyltransferase [Algibacter lectus]|uniref:Beta-1,3-glucosyltransferase n=1 Tax=Algibacter lectus TaxID=221126 RepID=A0A090WXV4_9FLAO|nr:glycosyltransferase family 2 protein [Algibacter lectus]GAL81806.1 beta-1,3-glucosyltransferase [Algibacter lectus]